MPLRWGQGRAPVPPAVADWLRVLVVSVRRYPPLRPRPGACADSDDADRAEGPLMANHARTIATAKARIDEADAAAFTAWWGR